MLAKFAVLALAAILAVQAHEIPVDDFDLEADSLASIVPDDDQEISYLSGAKVAFSDFCLSSRDHVVGDVKRLTNGMTADLFSLFFKSAEDISVSAIDAEKDATGRLSAQLRDPTAAIGRTGDDVSETQQQIQQGGGVAPQYLFQSVVAALRASANAVTTQLANKLTALKSVYGSTGPVVGAVAEICNKISQYETELRRQFNEARDELAASKPELKDITMEQVQCVTSTRILRIGGLCEFASVSKNPLVKMFTGARAAKTA